MTHGARIPRRARLLLAALLGQPPATPPASPSFDYDFYTARRQRACGRMEFARAPDGSTSRIFIQLSNFHGVAVIDVKERKEVSRFVMEWVPSPDGKLVYVAVAGDNSVTVVITATC